MPRFALAVLLLTLTQAVAQTPVTVMQLLRDPRQYAGRRVTVSGYYYSDWEGHGIFADRKAAKDYDTDRGIYVETDPNVESPVRKAQVIGVFLYSSTRLHGHTGVFTGFGVWGLFPAAVINCTVHFANAPNQAMQRTAGRSAFPLPMTSTLNQQQSSPSPAVADLVSR